MNWKRQSWFWRPALLGVLGIGGWLDLAAAADPAPDKSKYHLFNPTPRELMRELSTDRPDQTESAYTVDAGHVQVEMDLVNYFHDQTGGVTTEALAIAPVNLKFGLCNNVDVQFVLESYVRVKTRTPGTPATEADGTGDLLTRLKFNLWGNDGGATALAIMPFVKWPLSQSSLRNGKTEGGIIVPMAVALPAGWGLGLMTEVDFVRDSSNAYDMEYFNTITLSHDIVGNLGGYVEFAALFTPDSGAQWQGQIDLGFTYGFNENTQLDFGCNFGVTSTAPDYNPFVGLTLRF